MLPRPPAPSCLRVRLEDSKETAGRFPDCPFLPEPDAAMDWRSLHRHRSAEQDSLHPACLKYGQFLWRQGLAARALLAVDRGLLCASPDNRCEGEEFRHPFQAIAWIVAHTPPGVFIGNPRVHYQHLADRVRGDRAEQKRWRAWACWWLVRLVQPELPADPRHDVREPLEHEIESSLLQHGSMMELKRWHAACEGAASYRQSERFVRDQNSCA
ncbi:MAG: hypothetical protein ACREIA_26085 [Opitutaceae bacterium]